MFTTSTQLNEQCHSQPRPVLMLTCGRNIMPLSWHMPVSKSPFRYAVAVRRGNHTHQLLAQHRVFALNFLDKRYIDAVQRCGKYHGDTVDKSALSKLTPKEPLTIENTLIDEAYMIYESTLFETLTFGDHDIFVGEVNLVLNRKEVSPQPTLFLGRGHYETHSGEAIYPQRKYDV